MPPSTEEDRARLEVQVQAMRAVLVRLLQDVVIAESRLARADSAQIVEVNERLVVAALGSQADAEAATMALHDAQSSATLDVLTRLPNRAALAAQFVRQLAGARRNGSRLALLFLDLHDFKRPNGSHGRAFGDRLLQQAAVRMRAAVREVDMVSRHGGDQFLVLLADLVEPGDARPVAEKLIAAIGVPTEIDGHRVSVTASVGIALYPDDGQDLDTLVRLAAAAFHEAQRNGAGGIAFHRTAPATGDGAPAALPGRSVASDAERRTALLREANERLVLASVTAQELKQAADEARQQQAALVAAVAAELSNPMAPIRIAAAMLGRPVDHEPLLPRVQGIVEQQLIHVSRLVGKLVDPTNAETQLQLDSGPVDMGRVIDECVAAHRPTMRERGQSFDSNRPPGVLTVRGDVHRLVQILANLLDNASKHTHDGGRISLSAVVSADTLTLTVSDNGIGITPQVLPRIFDPFVQDVHAIGLRGIGLGIGLTIVRALVRAHGGNLVARSAGVARGSQFIVTLPLAADA